MKELTNHTRFPMRRNDPVWGGVWNYPQDYSFFSPLIQETKFRIHLQSKITLSIVSLLTSSVLRHEITASRDTFTYPTRASSLSNPLPSSKSTKSRDPLKQLRCLDTPSTTKQGKSFARPSNCGPGFETCTPGSKHQAGMERAKIRLRLRWHRRRDGNCRSEK